MRRRKSGAIIFNEVLAELGFATYWGYVNSDFWKELRERVLCLHNRNCQLCPMVATQVHHISYSRAVLLGKDLSKLIPLCRGCHESIEFKDGQKRTYRQALGVWHYKWRQRPAWVRRLFEKRVRQ